MGCAQSKIDNEEAVSRCKDRKIHMKCALLARSAFVVGHSAYAIALKNAGSALSDYGHGESPIDPDTAAVSAPPPPVSIPEPPPPPPPQEPLPPPPPPLPTFTPSPLQRSVTLPEFSVAARGMSKMESLDEPNLDEESHEKERSDKLERSNVKGMAWDYFFMSENMNSSGLGEIDEEIEDEDEDEDDDEDEGEDEDVDDDGHDHGHHDVGHDEEIEFTTPEKTVPQFVHSNTAPPEIARVVGKVEDGNGGKKVNLVKVLDGIDDCFLKASQCAQEVTKVLEAHKFQYHSNYADNRG